ncbi:hypothetical protein LP090_05920 [Moraxella bovis]|nr:hypothetical protein [Moraxella bovis]UYZ69842.1 hypothetical protein LP089_06725 [Moraxella bovis]UYZ74237.1 hypothetical protein LP105_05945 [Moraxella bovis]UZA44118.1 hypothetical protein LP090_05920 [Moraxella bovis]
MIQHFGKILYQFSHPFHHIKSFYGETSDPIISITSDNTAVLKKKDNTL